MDDITALQAVTEEVMGADVHLFTPREAVLWRRDFREDREVPGDKQWRGENAPEGTFIQYYLSAPSTGVTLRITDLRTGEVVRDVDATGEGGLNRVQWNLRENPVNENDRQGPRVRPGTYRVTLMVGGKEHSALVDVLEDEWMMKNP